MKIRGNTVSTPLARGAVVNDKAVSNAPWSAKKAVQTFGVPINKREMFVQIFPIDGTSISVKVTKPATTTHIKLYCTGKNLYPQTADAYEGGYINQKTGNVQSASSSICSKHIPVAHLVLKTLAITNAYVGGSNPGWAFYTVDGKYISGGNTATALVPPSAFSFRFTVKKSNISDDGTDTGDLDYTLIQLKIGDEAMAEAYEEISFDPCTENIELDRVFLDGLNTIYAYAGNIEGDTFIPKLAWPVSVVGYGDPGYEFEKLNAEIVQLKNAIIAMGANV